MSGAASQLGGGFDWGSLAPLRLHADTLAEGVLAGVHRSPRRGAGVEFGGHRAYVPGDDLRYLDSHALMRHGRLLVREFETETERLLRVMVDTTRSMAFRSERAPSSKYAFAALIAAALCRVALASGDPVALDLLGAESRSLPPQGGREAFVRVTHALLDATPVSGFADLAALERDLLRGARRARRGAILVVLSDLVDLPEGARESFARLATRGQRLIVVRVLDPVEKTFPFEGPLRLRASEGEHLLETEGAAARDRYLARLAAELRAWTDRIASLGGRVVDVATSDAPGDVVRAVLAAAEGRG